MLNDLIHWFSSLSAEGHVRLLFLFLLVDMGRYALPYIGMLGVDMIKYLWAWRRASDSQTHGRYVPTVCVIVCGYNEQASVEKTLNSIWGSYPRLKIIYVDDGSTDQTVAVVRRYAAKHEGIQLLTKPRRGGKSSSLNYGLIHANSDVVVNVDCDSMLVRGALWHAVQPLKDPDVGVVSGNILIHNPFTNLLTWIQACEYLMGISVGWRFSSWLGTMVIASGTFSAFRRQALQRVQGWDVGPGEDSDITVRLRKAGYRIVFAPRAICYTEAVTTWRALFRQRFRWYCSPIRELSRKHLDMSYPWAKHFRLSNLAIMFDVWVFKILLVYLMVFYAIWLPFHFRQHYWMWIAYLYLAYSIMSAIGVLLAMCYTDNRWRDLPVCAAFPLIPAFALLRNFVCCVSLTGEILFRLSYKDRFCPKHIREATWQW